MIVKMIQDLRKRMEKMQEIFTKGLEEQRNKQTELNRAVWLAWTLPALRPALLWLPN